MGANLSIESLPRWSPIAGAVHGHHPPRLTDGNGADQPPPSTSHNGKAGGGGGGGGGDNATDGSNNSRGISREHSTVMGRSAPPLYEHALVGDWARLLARISSHPTEVTYHDKRRNTALHLVCRRQPPVEVVAALLECADMVHGQQKGQGGGAGRDPMQESHRRTPSMTRSQSSSALVAASVAGVGTSDTKSAGVAPSNASPKNGGGGGGAEARTVDGLTPLHFACYCGASVPVVRMLLERYGAYRAAKRAASSKGGGAGGSGSKHGSRKGVPTQFEPPITISVRGGSDMSSPAHGDVPRIDHPPLDRRLRSPLHLALSGFRTPHRPSVVRLLLQATPSSATMADERGRTPLSLLYDDYAEELEDALSDACSPEKVRRMIEGSVNEQDPSEGGELAECWINLTYLLRASYQGKVGEDILCGTKSRRGDGGSESGFQGSAVSFHVSSSSLHNGSSSSSLNAIGASVATVQTSSEIDLLHGPFRPLHAAVGTLFYTPPKFILLILKAYPNAVSEQDGDFNLPLHVAARAVSTRQSDSRRLGIGAGGSIVFEYNPMRSVDSSTGAEDNGHRPRRRTGAIDAAASVIEKKRSGSYDVLPSAREGDTSLKNGKFYNADPHGLPSRDDADHATAAIIEILVQLNPRAASVPDESGKLPLVLAIETGKPWGCAIGPILTAYPDALCNEGSDGIRCIRNAVISGLTGPIPSVRTETALTVRKLVEHLPRKKGTTDADGIVGELLAAIRPGWAAAHSIGSPRSVVGDDASVISAASSVKTDVTVLSTSSTSGKGDSGIKSACLQALAGIFQAEASRRDQLASTTISVECETDKEDPLVATYATSMDKGENGSRTPQLESADTDAIESSSRNTIISLPSCAEAGFRVGLKNLRHSDENVREAAAKVIGGAVALLGAEVAALALKEEVLSFDTKKKRKAFRKGGTGNSRRSVGTTTSAGSWVTARENDDSDDDGESKQLSEASHHQKGKKLPASTKHGRISACYHILVTSPCAALPIWIGDSKNSENASIIKDTTKLVKEAMLDEDAAVRRCGCLAMGVLISLMTSPQSLSSKNSLPPPKAPSSPSSTLKEVRSAVLKCMRTTEEEDVHIALARGLMTATKNNSNIFLCKMGLPILDGALMLSVSMGINPSVQRAFHGFLWLALGVGEQDNGKAGADGLSIYMSLAEGENGKVMMTLVSKTSSKIERVNNY